MAMQQATAIITGFVGTDPIARGANGLTVSTFRVASTRSYFHRERNTWVDCPTTWITVKAFRNLSDNVQNSIRKGDAVLVVGSLVTEQWRTEQGENRTSITLEATNIGHDINHGITSLRKVERREPVTPQTGAGAPQVSAAGAVTGADPFAGATQAGQASPTGAVIPGVSNESDSSTESYGSAPFAGPVPTTANEAEATSLRTPDPYGPTDGVSVPNDVSGPQSNPDFNQPEF